MKITRYSICRPIEGLCKSWAIWGGNDEDSSISPLVYLTRPKWIKDDASWEKIVNSIKLSLLTDTEIS
jgi:hypothetical protein